MRPRASPPGHPDQPFFITGLPRTGTAWLANFLTTGDTFCHHDLTASAATVQALADRLGPGVGDADSGLVFVAREILQRFPASRWVFIERSPREACASLAQALDASQIPALSPSASALLVDVALAARRMLSAAGVPLLRVRFDDIFTEAGARAIWNHVFPSRSFDERRFALLRALSVERRPETITRRPALAVSPEVLQGSIMATKNQASRQIRTLSSALRSQPKEVAEALLRVLQDRVAPAQPSVAQLTGLLLEATGKIAIDIVDTTGARHRLTHGKPLALTPVSLTEAREKAGASQAAVGAVHPFPSSLLLVSAAVARGTSALAIDAAPLYRNWGQWGPMQVVVRTASRAGETRFEVVGDTPLSVPIAAGEAVDIVGVGYAPRIDAAAIFARFGGSQGGGR
jgi:hypothetical protein